MSNFYISMVNGENPGIAITAFGLTRNFAKDHADFDKIVELVRKGDEDSLREYLKPQVEAKTTADNSNGLFQYEGGHLSVGGVVVPEQLKEKILQAHELGLEEVVLSYVNFFRRIQKNPSYNSVNRLFACLEVNHHPITPDGFFKAYKKVKRSGSRLVDIYSGNFDNTPGQTPSVDRKEVDDDYRTTCSRGLHVASFAYAAHSYGNPSQPLVEVLVDPADVVTVPEDYNCQKMRVCKYHVVKEVSEEDMREFAPELANIYLSSTEDYDDEYLDETELEVAYDEGHEAYINGRSRFDNDYSSGIFWDKWNHGWLDARAEDSI